MPSEELAFILERFGVDLKAHSELPIQIPNCGRDDLARLFGELEYRKGAEIGVAEGIYAQALLEAGDPRLHLYAIDAYQAYEGYFDFERQRNIDSLRALASARLSPYENHTIIPEFSLDAAKRFGPESLDFVYIDANHAFQYVVDDICTWSSRVRPGGIVSGHDFEGRRGNTLAMHVIEAVVGFTSAYRIRPWFLLGSKEIVPGEVRDKPRSWFWVKE